MPLINSPSPTFYAFNASSSKSPSPTGRPKMTTPGHSLGDQQRQSETGKVKASPPELCLHSLVSLLEVSRPWSPGYLPTGPTAK